MSSVTLEAEPGCTDEVDGLENGKVAEQENTDDWKGMQNHFCLQRWEKAGLQGPR